MKNLNIKQSKNISMNQWNNEAMKQLNKGFTLVEVLIATFIFATVTAISVGIFASSANTQIVTETQRTVVQDERFMLDQLSRDIRLAQCGFQFCSGPSDNSCGGITEGNYIIIYPSRDANGKCDSPASKMYGLSADGNIEARDGNNVGALFSVVYKISNYISEQGVIYPIFSGYYPSGASDQQPYVTIQFNIENREEPAKEAEKIKQTIITTVTSRAYSEIGDWKK